VEDVETISEIKHLLLNQPCLHLQNSKVYDGKISRICIDKLLRYFREDIAEAQNAYVMPKVLAHSYMSRLASVIAHNDRAIPLTDDGFGNSILQSRYLNYYDEQVQNQTAMVKLSLKTIFINLNVPLIDVMQFRDRHREKLLNFRRRIRSLSRQMAQRLDTTTQQRAFEELIKDEVVPASAEIKAKLEENNLRFVATNILLTLAGCAGVAISGEWLGHLVNIGILAGAALVGNIRQERLIIKDHLLGYLYQAQGEFGLNQ